MTKEKETVKTTLAKNKEGYGYKYTELADINKYCEANDIRYYQEVETNEINQKDYIVTYVTKNGETTRHRGCQIVEARLNGINNPVMEYGSSLTYCRRYSLLMAMGLATEDDDGASLTVKETKEVTEDDAMNYTFQFGKHKGKKLIALVNDGSNYIQWLVNNSNDEYLLKCIELLTGQVKLTEEEQDDRIQLKMRLQRLLVDKGVDLEAMLDYYQVKTTDMLTNEQLKELITRFEARADK
jgi:hypothetical protein